MSQPECEKPHHGHFRGANCSLALTFLCLCAMRRWWRTLMAIPGESLMGSVQKSWAQLPLEPTPTVPHLLGCSHFTYPMGPLQPLEFVTLEVRDLTRRTCFVLHGFVCRKGIIQKWRVSETQVDLSKRYLCRKSCVRKQNWKKGLT